jgi:poly-gamma-glutamate capsule biosynthesis protein CapA/YwtB (metallophosphatase superfamily)
MIYRSESRSIRMLLTGDTMLSRRLSPFKEPEYLALVDMIRQADVSFTNLESTIRERDEGAPVFQHGTPMTTPPALLGDLRWMGFDILSMANNHATDYGVGGILASIAHLRRADFPFAGTGANLAEARAPAYVDVGAGRVALVAGNAFFSAPGTQAGEQRRDSPGRPGANPIGFTTGYTVDDQTLQALLRASRELGFSQDRARQRALFYSENEMPKDEDDRVAFLGHNFQRGNAFSVTTRTNPADQDGVLRAIREARRQADWVIFSFHYHELGDRGRLEAKKFTEMQEPAGFVVDLARAAIDAGADAVVGHGPHLTLGAEIYKSRPILYSLGNFVLQNDSIEVVPAESYARFGLGPDAGPADFLDARTGNDTRSFPVSREYWESVMAQVDFADGRLSAVRLVPIDLGFGRSRPQRGRPVLARGDAARNAIARITELSKIYGTEIGADGTIRLT